MCEFLLSLLIVGAVEVTNGWMQVQYLHPMSEQVFTLYMPTDDYIRCQEVR